MKRIKPINEITTGKEKDKLGVKDICFLYEFDLTVLTMNDILRNDFKGMNKEKKANFKQDFKNLRADRNQILRDLKELNKKGFIKK